MTGMAAAKAHIMQQFITKEKDRILAAFASDPSGEHRAITKVAKRLLLNAPYLLNGQRWDIVAKALGAGVYHLTLKKYKGER